MAGAELWLANSTAPEDWQSVADLAAADPGIIPGFGLHPWKVSAENPGWKEDLQSRLALYPRAFIGEIGLDRWIERRDEARQEEAFRHQMDLAVSLQRPVQIHALRADQWLLKVLDALPALAPSWMLHSWGGSANILRAYVDRGAFLSVSGYHLDPRHKRHHETLFAIPPDRLLIETDAPDMAPSWVKHTSNQPVNPPTSISRIYEGVALLRQIPLPDLIARVKANATRFLAPL